LDDAIATHLEERRHEPMETAVEHEPAQAFPTERAEGTATVLDHVVAEPVAHAVRDTGGQPAHHRIAVAAVHAPPRAPVPSIWMAQEARDVARIVLPIGVHRPDQTAAP